MGCCKTFTQNKMCIQEYCDWQKRDDRTTPAEHFLYSAMRKEAAACCDTALCEEQGNYMITVAALQDIDCAEWIKNYFLQ